MSYRCVFIAISLHNIMIMILVREFHPHTKFRLSCACYMKGCTAMSILTLYTCTHSLFTYVTFLTIFIFFSKAFFFFKTKKKEGDIKLPISIVHVEFLLYYR